MQATTDLVLQDVTLADLALLPGHAFRLHAVAEPGAVHDFQYLGVLEGSGVLIVPVGVASLKVGLKPGLEVMVRGFTGRFDFAFISTVTRVFDFTFRDPPVAYALLSYPADVRARQVRRAQRVRVDLAATAVPRGEDRRIPVVVRDLSTAGALLVSDEPPGIEGSELVVHLDIDLDGEHIAVQLPATVVRQGRAEGDVALTGVLFQDVLANDKLALHYLVGRGRAS
jgi:hypothetical protein